MKKLFVLQETIRFQGKRPEEKEYLKEWEHVGVGFEYYWTKDINEAYLFDDKAAVPKLQNSKRNDWPNFTYRVVPVQIQVAEPKKIWQEEKKHKIEQQYNDGKPRLYVITDGEEWIPVVTDDYRSIRSDVGNEDHGGMPWAVFSKLCDSGEIRQIKSLNDMPEINNSYPYMGGRVESFGESCRELIERMDEEGVIQSDEDD